MTEELKLLFVLAHPDDETLGNGGTIARYADEGIEVHLVTATGGEEGWFGAPEENPGPEELARIREKELRGAAEVLGVSGVSLLGYHDGVLANASTPEVVGKIVSHIRRIRPQVVVTFDQNGLYGHPDHIAITQFTTAAVAAAGASGYADAEGREAHAASKLYYMAWTREDVDAYEEVFGELVMQINGHERGAIPWPEWSITTSIDTKDRWRQVWEAVRQHRTQLPQYERLLALPEAKHAAMWGRNLYYRAFSSVDCGDDAVESDLFAGLR